MKPHRRLLIRVLGWMIAGLASVLAVCLLGLAVYVLFFNYPEHIRRWMEREASQVLGRDVRIASFSVDLPNSFELRGLRAARQEPGTPWLELRSLRGRLHLAGVFRGGVELASLEVDGLTLRVHDYGGGRLDLPGLASPPSRPWVPAGTARWAIRVDHIIFRDASFVYANHHIPWGLEAFELTADLERLSKGYAGHIAYGRGKLQVKDRPSFPGSMEAELELRNKSVHIRALQARGPFYQLRAEGDVRWAETLQAAFELDIESQVREAARSLLGWPGWSGAGSRPARLRGSLSMGRGWHLLRGELNIPQARWHGIGFRNWKGRVRWDRSALELTDLQGRLGGGSGQVQLRQPFPVSNHAAGLAAQVRNVSFRTLAEELMGVSPRLDASVSGGLSLSIPSGSPDRLSGHFELAGVRPEGSDEGMDFSVGGEIEEGTVVVESSRFRTDDVAGSLSGAYPRTGSADITLDIDAVDLAEADRLQQLLRTLLHPQRPAGRLGLTGKGRAVGHVTGRLPRLSFEGRFQGTDVGFRGIPLGEVEARGRWSSSALALESFRARGNGGSLIAGKVETALTTLPPPDWSFEGTLRNWQISDFPSFLPVPEAVHGTLGLEGRFASRSQRLMGEGVLTLNQAGLFGVDFDQGSVQIHLDGRRVELRSLRLSRAEARVEGHLIIDVDSAGVDGKLHAERVPLSLLAGERLKLTGNVAGDLQMGGRLGAPDLHVEARATEMALDGAALGEARLEAFLREGTARASLSLRHETLNVTARARLILSGRYPLSGELVWRRADLGPWIRLARSDLPRSLRFFSDGQASFSGELSGGESLRAEASLGAIRAEIAGYRLESRLPMKARLRQGTIEIDRLQLSGKGTRVDIAGKLPLGEGNLNLEVKGAVNLDILQSFYPSVTSAGGVELSARVEGGWQRPRLSGRADVDSGVLRIRGFPQALGDVRGRIFFDNRTVRFPDMRARFGAAAVRLSGTLVLKGLRPASFEVRAAGEGVRLRYPEGLVATLDADLQLSGTPQSQLLAGRVDVRKAQWTREYDLATGILVRRGASPAGMFEDIDAEGPLSHLRLDVGVMAPGTLSVRNSRASIDADAQLQLRGTFSRPILLGRAEALRGELFLLGQRYSLLSGRVEFIDPNAVKPLFDVVAETRVRSYRVELRLTGTPQRFFPELSSDPPLRTVDILRLLAGASERDILIGSEEEEIAGVGVASLLTERLTSEVGRRAERLFGLDRFSIDPFLVGQFTNPTARVSMGKQIHRDLSVSYSTNLNATTETLILIEYAPEGPISWIISRDEEGAFGVDIRFRKSF